MYTVLQLLYDGQYATGAFLEILKSDSITFQDTLFGGQGAGQFDIYASIDDATFNNLNAPNRIDTYMFADILAVAAPAGQGNGIAGGNYSTAGTVGNPVVQFVPYQSTGSGLQSIPLYQTSTVGNTLVCVMYSYEPTPGPGTGWTHQTTALPFLNVYYQTITTANASAFIQPINFPVYGAFVGVFEIFNVPTTGSPIMAIQTEYSSTTNASTNILANPYTNTLTSSGACLAISIAEQSSTPINATIGPSGAWFQAVNQEVWTSFGSIAWTNLSYGKFSGGTVQATNTFINPVVGTFGATPPNTGIANASLILIKLNS